MHTITESLTVALAIMAVGMFMVFLFLGILIGGVNLVASRYAPKPGNTETERTRPATQTGGGARSATPAQVEPRVLAAITAAIHEYRTKAKY
ncbi:OadG family protein [Shewanella sp. GXUN23E]|uniref:OadG family protein n=1 Tax=Shewanella sp. GXUN23E TaxID=3422498 RepID=UPI003D7C8DC6